MNTAKVFINGNSQAVRLPREFRVTADELIIKRVGDVLMLVPQRYRARSLLEALADLDPGFSIARRQPRRRQARRFA
jgi:antitoxin VapB